MGLPTKGALSFHLKHVHPESCLFACPQCEGSFNNRADLAVHVWGVHLTKKVKCKHCEYKMTSSARMRMHVRLHMQGLKCKKCGKCYPNTHSLVEHMKLHGTRQVHQCASCGKSFMTEHSLQIHDKGNHGSGYPCKCGTVFKSPVQWARHAKKCTLK